MKKLLVCALSLVCLSTYAHFDGERGDLSAYLAEGPNGVEVKCYCQFFNFKPDPRYILYKVFIDSETQEVISKRILESFSKYYGDGERRCREAIKSDDSCFNLY